jgi:predicted O-methyltransferase YrrM
MKSLELISHLRNPSEFLDRVSAIFTVRRESFFGSPPKYQTVGVEEGLECLIDTFGYEIAIALEEPNLAQIEKRVGEKQADLPPSAPFARSHNGDALLGRLCYALARTIRPKAVVETGVCYGVSSAYLLAALETNREGRLYSIDLPPLGKDGDNYVGWLVPGNLRRRWTFERGTSRRLLGPLAEMLGSIDLFVHDSQHTYKNMKFEFETAWPALRPGGVLISDDVEGNAAFSELTRRRDVASFAVIREKDKSALVGVAVKRQ